MCIGTISFVQGWQLFSESRTDPLFPEMKRHGLNYLETNGSKERLGETQAGVGSIL